METSVKIKKNFTCVSCFRLIDCKDRLYSCTDAFVCSPECCIKRLNFVKQYDPHLTSPRVWPLHNVLESFGDNSIKSSTINKSGSTYSLHERREDIFNETSELNDVLTLRRTL